MSVIAFAEQREGALRNVALEATSVGRRVADELDAELIVAVLGPPGIGAASEDLGRYGADRVVIAAADILVGYAPEGYTELLSGLVEQRAARAVVFPASALGKDLAPRVAARLRAGLATEVTGVEVKDGRIEAVRPIYAGKVLARVGFQDEPALLSIRPLTFQPEEQPREAEVEELAVELGPELLRTQVERVEEQRKKRPDVAEAEMVVSGGRGMGGPENWPLLEELADALGPKAALGASRAVVDAGWRPHAEQVGQTGKVVSPQLYFAIGISGAIQHQAGMRTSRCIVAVNKDPEAPIFQLADYGIVGDLFEVVPRLTEAIRELRSE